MASITTRVGKGSPLTTQELDANFTNLNTDKVEKSGTDPVVISVNSASNALRITQTGAGNALVVEDSANPDSTPFVIDANGGVIAGSPSPVLVAGFTPKVQTIATSTSGSSNALIAFANDATTAPQIYLSKSRGAIGTVGTSVSSGDTLGAIQFTGDDGTGLIRGAQIIAVVDGTPGTNDMPGRLVFSTTAGGASSPTERMRIDNQGRVGIGTTSLANSMVRSSGNVTGAVTMRGIQQSGIVQSDVTTASYCFTTTNVGTQAAAFTLPILTHFYADQGTIGAGSTVTVQYGFFSQSTLTGATNNYGFYSNIASGTGRWNFYAAGTADNYFAGNVLVGATSALVYGSTGTPQLQVNRTDGNSVGVSRWSNGSAGTVFGLAKSRGTAVGTRGVVSSGDTIGAVSFDGDDGAAFVTAASISAAVDGTPGTNDMPGRLIFSTTADGASSPTERMRIDNQGRVGIGASPYSGVKFLISGNTDTAAVDSILNTQAIQSTTTTKWNGFATYPSTQAAAFTITSLRHFAAEQAVIGAGSIVTNQHGFYSNIASGTGRYNFYAAGTADNYFAGPLTFTPAASATPANNGNLTFEATSNTSLTIKLKGTDGTVRSVALTLA